jgi:hypothetical protein
MKKTIYWTMLLSLGLLACSKEAKQDNSQRDTSAAVQKAQQRAAELHKQQMQNILDNRYSFDKIDNQGLEQKLKKARSREEVIAAFTEAGMTNAEEYVASIEERMGIFAHTFKENPDWSDDEKKNFMKKSMEDGGKEVKDSIMTSMRNAFDEKRRSKAQSQ